MEPNPSKRPADVAEDEKEAKRKRALELLGDDLKVRFLVSFWFAHGIPIINL